MNALIVEGGALRTVFSAGVLDAFLVNQFDPFDLYLGVSGGSMSMTYYLSEAYRVTYDVLQGIMKDERFMAMKNLFSDEGYINLSYLQEFADQYYPLNLKELTAGIKNKKVEIVATNLDNGQPVYLWPTVGNWKACLKASSTLPFLTSGFSWIGKLKLMDGGWSDPIPVQRAINLGADKIVIVRSQPLSYRSEWRYIGMLGQFLHRDNEAMRSLFAQEHIVYNQALDILKEDHPQKIIQISPPTFLKTTAYSATEEKLEMDYRTGLDVGLQFLREHGEGF